MNIKYFLDALVPFPGQTLSITPQLSPDSGSPVHQIAERYVVLMTRDLFTNSFPCNEKDLARQKYQAELNKARASEFIPVDTEEYNAYGSQQLSELSLSM